jgi:hypothetical protein
MNRTPTILSGYRVSLLHFPQAQVFTISKKSLKCLHIYYKHEAHLSDAMADNLSVILIGCAVMTTKSPMVTWKREW